MPKIPTTIPTEKRTVKPRRGPGWTEAKWIGYAVDPLTDQPTILIPSTAKAMPSCLYIGIDPGKSGGIAGIIESDVVLAKAMPETEKDIWDLIDSTSHFHASRMAVVEWINPGYQGTGKSSMSKLYGSFMALRMAVTAADIRVEIITPRRWQKALDIASRKENETTSQWKNRLKAKAQQLFPTATITLATADAVLIAEYCRRKNLGLIQ